MRLCRALPSSLLLLSRAFTMTQPQGARAAVVDEHMEGLKDTLGALNKEVLEEVGYEVGDLGCVQCPAFIELCGRPWIYLFVVVFRA